MIPILANEHRWDCPNCPVTAVTSEARPHTQMHHCAGLAGLWTPMVPAGTRCKVEALEREDYVGHEIGVRTDGEGTPMMAAVVTRDDGEDRTVYAPAARGSDDEAR
jgi:hypothetical protein